MVQRLTIITHLISVVSVWNEEVAGRNEIFEALEMPEKAVLGKVNYIIELKKPKLGQTTIKSWEIFQN